MSNMLTHRPDDGWDMSRFRRQVRTLLGLAWPATLARIGVIVLATVDTLMVGHYSTQELAYLNLGSSTIVMFVLLCSVGLLIGTLVRTADAYGREDWEGAGRVWRRAMPYALITGLVSLLVCLPASWMFSSAGMDDLLATEGGKVMMVLGLGLPGHMVYIHSIFFLEGVERTKVGMYAIIVANVINTGLNYILVYGGWGIDPMGAVGSAWATTILRNLMAIFIVVYMLRSSGLAHYKLTMPWRGSWTDWQLQRRVGYAAGVAVGAEVGAFAMLSIFAGWMGTIALASWGIILNVMSLVFMISAGLGVAASVRVGIAKSREDYKDAALAGWTAVLLAAIGLIAAGMCMYIWQTDIARAYSSDLSVLAYTAPLIGFAGLVMLLDGEQAVLANSLRGASETWAPMGIQFTAYVIVMIPVSYYLSIALGREVQGLLEAVIIASVVSVFFQALRFHWITIVVHRRHADLIL